MVKAMDMPVHNIHGFCHASMGNVMAWQNSYYMTFVMLYEFCHAAWVLPYNPLFDPWHAVQSARLSAGGGCNCYLGNAQIEVALISKVLP